MGPSLPFKFCKCMYYFNIAGNTNDKSQIYLVALINSKNEREKKNVILQNNQWIEDFTNHQKLLFPQFESFGSHFMVCLRFRLTLFLNRK